MLLLLMFVVLVVLVESAFIRILASGSELRLRQGCIENQWFLIASPKLPKGWTRDNTLRPQCRRRCYQNE